MIMQYAFSILAELVAGIAYRIRGGGWISFGSTIEARLVWFGGLALAYLMQTATHSSLWFCLSLLPTTFLSMMVPHAYCQNIGRWATPQKKWPSFFLPTISPDTWTAMPMWQRQLYDCVSMAAIGFLRGLIVFTPYVLISFYIDHGVLHAILLRGGIAVATISVLQSFAYWVGWYIPISITSALPARSNCWGEFYNGWAWAIAIGIL